MKQKHLAAFTLLELITVLVLSTIIIGIAYTAYELIYKDFTAYKNNNESVLETLDFVTLLENDFSACFRRLAGLTFKREKRSESL